MSIASKILVFIQFSCLIYFTLFSDFLTSGLFLVLQLIGFTLSIWSVLIMKLGNFNVQPEVKKGAVFIQTGPYRFIRNPMYSGLIIFFGTAVFCNGHLWDIAVFLVLVTVLLLKVLKEEKLLEERFGSDYLSYKQNTKRFIPYLF